MQGSRVSALARNCGIESLPDPTYERFEEMEVERVKWR
jgi:hypothetical protein